MQEIWKTVVTEDGIYENYMVSNLGNVKSLNYLRTGKEKILKQIERKDGYFNVQLCKNGKTKIYFTHRLVAMAFIPNVMNYACIDHKDTNRKNNSILNLVWCTKAQNNNNELTKKKASEAMKGKHRTEETKKKISENSGKSKKVLCIEIGEIFASTMEASRQLNINNNSISSVCRKEHKQTHNLTFRYLNQVLFYN